MPRGFSQKVGDQFTVPLCYPHHHLLHTNGMSEKDFWSKLDIDAVDICSKFYSHYHDMWKNKNFFYDGSQIQIVLDGEIYIHMGLLIMMGLVLTIRLSMENITHL